MEFFQKLCYLILGLFVLSEAAPTLTDETTVDPYAEDMARRKEMALECIKEVNIGQTLVEKIVELQIDSNSDTELLPRDKIYKDFLACSYKKQGYQSEEGKMVYENIKEFMSRFYERKDLEIIDGCKTITDGLSDHGEIAFSALECVVKKLKKIDEAQEEKLNENQI